MMAMIGLSIVYGQEANASKTGKKASVKEYIDGRNFVFKAQSAMPVGGRTIQLTSEYDLRVNGDTLIVYLPYYGRAYVAPMDPSKGGINFTSTSFDYTVSQGKKGNINIAITPKDNRDVRQMFISTSESGYASLQVTSNNRQAILFNGYIEEKR